MSVHWEGGDQSLPILNPSSTFYNPGCATYSYVDKGTRQSCRSIFTNANKNSAIMLLKILNISIRRQNLFVWLSFFPIPVQHGCPCISSSSTQRQAPTFAACRFRSAGCRLCSTACSAAAAHCREVHLTAAAFHWNWPALQLTCAPSALKWPRIILHVLLDRQRAV